MRVHFRNTGKPGFSRRAGMLARHPLSAARSGRIGENFALRPRGWRLGSIDMARRLFQFFVAAALVVAVGGHWAVLQSVAWVSMVVTYSQTDSWDVALQKTFSGEKPCKLCLAVKEGKQQEQKQSVLKVETKLDFVCLK